MSLLFRILLRNNTLIVLPALFLGTGIYVLTDLFERLDNFVDAQLGLGIMATYFVYKVPLIISQILPVVFLLATVIQLCLMIRNRELTALYAGGVSPRTLLRMLFLCGVLWSGIQLGFSQWLGVLGEQESNRIWQEQVHNRNMHKTLKNLWFIERDQIISLGTLHADNTGEGLLIYALSPDGLQIEEVIRAERYTAEDGNWTLYDIDYTNPKGYLHERRDEMTITLRQDLDSFRLVNSGANPQLLSVFQLGDAIHALEASGSNVELLRTAWHAKLAYAASLAVMTLVAMAIATWKDNIYIASGLALMATFLYYALYTVAGTLGQQGIVPPPFAAWLANILAAAVALGKLAPILISRR